MVYDRILLDRTLVISTTDHGIGVMLLMRRPEGFHDGKVAQLHEEIFAEVNFHAVYEPQRAVTPGQAAVFYDGERTLGRGWIGR